jgi:hypothetical protein
MRKSSRLESRLTSPKKPTNFNSESIPAPLELSPVREKAPSLNQSATVATAPSSDLKGSKTSCDLSTLKEHKFGIQF